jgi:hypothetical protein
VRLGFVGQAHVGDSATAVVYSLRMKLCRLCRHRSRLILSRRDTHFEASRRRSGRRK